jgi:hypothetical protein
VVARRDLLAEQPVGADDVQARRGSIDHQQMIADRVISVDVAAKCPHRRGRLRAHLVVEDLIAERLGSGDLVAAAGEPNIQLAGLMDPARRAGAALKIAHASPVRCLSAAAPSGARWRGDYGMKTAWRR